MGRRGGLKSPYLNWCEGSSPSTGIMTTNTNKPLFHRAHYNILAAQIKRQLEPLFTAFGTPANWATDSCQWRIRNAFVDYTLKLTQRLLEDNPNFRPLAFLDACSPDPDLYPLSELWAIFNG